MKTSILVLAALVVIAFSSVAFAAMSSISPITLTISNATVTHATSATNTTYNISFMYTSLYSSVQSFRLTFPQGTRFNGTTVPANTSQAVTNMTNDGTTVNGTFNFTVMLPQNTTSPQTNNTIYINLGNGGINLNITNGTVGTYYFSFVLTNIGNPSSANGSTVYAGFTLQEVTAYTENGTQVAGGSGNTSTFTLAPQNATNFTVSFGNGQSVVANTTPTYNLTVLVTDQFGNPYAGQIMNFSSRNTSSATANLTVSINGSTPLTGEAGFWYQNVLNTTNATGQAGVNVHLGYTTSNNSNEVYQVMVRNSSAGQAVSSFANGSMFTVFNVTPVAGTIDYYILTPSAAPAYYDTAFNILVHSYDTIGTVDNINTTSAYSGTLVANANQNTSVLWTSNDNTAYTRYSAGISRTLSSGNVTTWFNYQTTGPIQFTFTDDNSATGSVNVTVTGAPGGGSGGGSSGGSSTATPTPTPSTTTTPSATPTPAPTAPPVIKETEGVTGSFFEGSASFALTYTAGSSGFYGDLTWRLPFDYADYQAGLITITPAPSSVEEGSVKATWSNVDLPANGQFNPTVTVGKNVDTGVMSQFAAPTLSAKARPSVEPTPIPTSSVAPAPVKKPVAGGDNSLLVGIVVLILLAAGAYYFFLKPKKRGL